MRRKRVALIEWNWKGHHPTYFQNYAQALLCIGCEVLALCPEPDALLKNSAFQEALSQGRLHVQQLRPNRRRIRPASLKEALRLAMTLRQANKLLRTYESQAAAPVDLVFFACIYDHEFESFRYFQSWIQRPISGLYLYSHAFRQKSTQAYAWSGRKVSPEKLFSYSAFQSVTVLDEGISDQFQASIKKPVFVMPEITDNTLPEVETAIATRLKRVANGRHIIGSLGFLHPYKGITTLAQAAMSDRADRYCYAFIGEVTWSAYRDSDRQQIEQLLLKKENVFFHPFRVPDGAEFNGAAAACDVIHAAYHDFPNSSNILSKGALLKKPVIVSDGYLMAERVRRYHMGQVVKEQDASALMTAIHALFDGSTAPEEPNWDAYLKEHSFDALCQSFRSVVSVES